MRAVDLDQAALVDLDAGLLQAQALDVGAAAGGDAQPGPPRACSPPTVDLHRVAGVLHVLHVGAGHDLHVLLADLAARRPWRSPCPPAAGSGPAPRAGSRRCPGARTPTPPRCPTRPRRSRPAASAARRSATCRRCPRSARRTPGRPPAAAPSRRPGSPCRPRSRVPSNEPPTFTLPSSVTAPRPSITSILFFSNSIATPPVSVLITLSRCLVAPPKSNFTSPTVMPKLLAPWTSFIASATRSTAFAGMHASLRQRPPTCRPSRPRRSSCRAGRRGWRPRSRPARSRSRCSRTCSQPLRADPIDRSSAPGGLGIWILAIDLIRNQNSVPASADHRQADEQLDDAAGPEDQQREDHHDQPQQRLHAQHRPVAIVEAAPGGHQHQRR